jgi:DNA-binding MarR family transcriptional regulator
MHNQKALNRERVFMDFLSRQKSEWVTISYGYLSKLLKCSHPTAKKLTLKLEAEGLIERRLLSEEDIVLSYRLLPFGRRKEAASRDSETTDSEAKAPEPTGARDLPEETETAGMPEEKLREEFPEFFAECSKMEPTAGACPNKESRGLRSRLKRLFGLGGQE